MKRLIPLITAAFLTAAASAQPLTTAFTFQGQLTTAGSPATGTYDARFRLYDALTGGNQIGPTLCADNVAVAGGLFTTQLDFGAQFAGQQRFLEIDVRQDTGLPCSNSTGFTTLGPRQALTAAPNADFALTAASAASATTATTATTATNATQFNGQPPSFYTNAANLTGTLPGARLTGTYSSQLNLSNTSNTIAGSFTGSGAGLTNIPWTSITNAPSPVLLLPSLGFAPQNGNLHINGIGQFDQGVSIGLNPTGYLLAVGGPALFKTDFSDGDMLHFGDSGALPLGVTTEVGESVLNFDMNFRVLGHNTQYKGAALRLDGRSGSPPIQFLTRPANSNAETSNLTISEQGTVYVGPTTFDVSYFEVNDGGVPRPNTAMFLASGPAGRAVVGQTFGTYGVVGANVGSGAGAAGMLAYSSDNTAANYGLLAQNWSHAGIALAAQSNATTGSTVAVQAENFSPDGTVLLAQQQAGSGFNFAVHAISNSPNAQTIYAESTATSGAPIVIHALNRSNSGYAGYFEGPSPYVASFNNTGNGRGLLASSSTDAAVWAQSSSGAGLHATCSSGNAIIATSDSNDCIVATTNGSAKTAVNGFANQPNSTGGYFSSSATSGSGNGVVGLSNSPTAYAVYALGRFAATGTKSFRIDHPADPTHKYLMHYCTESPEVLNAYRGTVTLNQQGEATIDLPAYFARINKDPSYTLTAVGAPMPLLHVSQEVSDTALADGAKAGPSDPAPLCSFTIAGGAPNGKVSWRIEAVRNDRWVQAHGAPVEVNKEGPDDGTYQHPDLYDQPAEKGAFYHEPEPRK